VKTYDSHLSNFISRPYLVWSRLCYSVVSVDVVLKQKLLLTAYRNTIR